MICPRATTCTGKKISHYRRLSNQTARRLLKRTFTIAAHFHPGCSLLGRWIRRRSPDHRSGESTYLVAAVTLGAAILISQYLAWAYLYPMSASAMTAFIVAQVVLAACYTAVAVVGRQPAVHVTAEDNGLTIQRGHNTTSIAYTDVHGVSVISSELYHTHYARYAATQAFVNRTYPTVLLLSIGQRPVVLGLAPEVQVEFERMLERKDAPTTSRPHVGAA